MSMEMIVIVLLIWTVAGLLAAVAFGRMIRETDNTPGDEEPLLSSMKLVRYLRRDKRKPRAPSASGARMRNGAAKRAAG